ncbi:MAG: hypothetical protein EZS28_048054, partial [Streblomastix strix]
QLSKMKDVANSLLIKSFVNEYQLNSNARPKYEMIWKISTLFNLINKQNKQSYNDIKVKAMALLVAFPAARMTELARIVLEDINFIKEQMQIQLFLKYGGILRNDTIKLNPRHSKCYQIEALQARIDRSNSSSLQQTPVCLIKNG